VPPVIKAATSRDALLGGRVTIIQPENGYRAAIDPLLLAASVPAKSGETVLDLGSGTGAAALALAARVDGVNVVGLEAQGALVALARKSAEESGLSDRVTFVEGDLLSMPADFPATFDHVIANPPYLAAGGGNPPPDVAKRAATVEGEAVLSDWLKVAQAMAGDGASISVIHRFDRKQEVADGLAEGAGNIVVFPLWVKEAGKDAKRVIVQAWKGKGGELRAAPRTAPRTAKGLVLHQANGDFTPEAEAVLRDAQSIRL